MVKVGDHVIYCDSKGIDHNALVQIVWGPECVNLVFIAADENKKDQYGRQIEHQTSVTHAGPTTAHGRYWRLLTEEAVPYSPPVSQ